MGLEGVGVGWEGLFLELPRHSDSRQRTLSCGLYIAFKHLSCLSLTILIDIVCLSSFYYPLSDVVYE